MLVFGLPKGALRNTTSRELNWFRAAGAVIAAATGTKSARAGSPYGGIGAVPPAPVAASADCPSTERVKEKSGPPGLHLYVVRFDKPWRKRIAALSGSDLRKHHSRRYR